jgi:hypothetical protein
MPATHYPTKSAWRRAYNRRKDGFMRANERFIEDAPHETPASLRKPHIASEWIALSPEERRRHVRAVADEFVRSKIGPAPEPATLTLSALERRVIEQADSRAADLRATLKGSPARVEELVEAQRPAFRAEAFDRLVATHRIIEG